MPRRPAVITQADVARVIRAAKQTGVTGIEVKPDGTLLIRLDNIPPPPTVEQRDEASLDSGNGEVLF